MIETHEDIKIDDFIIELKLKGVEYDPDNKKHWVGSTEFKDENSVTNNDMRTMCEKYFGNDYNFLTDPEQRKLRDKIFAVLRGNTNG